MTFRPLIWIFALLLAFGHPLSMAYGAEPLFISETSVDIMGENAADARTLGTVQAKKQAIDDLFKKFVPEHRVTIMDSLTPKKIDKIVRKIEVLNESVDGNRFRARFRISYSAAMFNDLITKKIEAMESDQQLLTTASIVLPIFETNNRLYLFESVNPWGTAWANVARNIGRGQLVTPYGDSVDYSLISAKNAENADFKEFSALRRRYGVRDVIVLHARFLTKSDETQNAQEEFDLDEEDEAAAARQRKRNLVLQVRERRVQSTEDEIKTIEFMMDAAENKAELMERAARDLGIYIMNMQGNTASEVAEAQKTYGRLLVVMPVTTMKRFAWVKEQLSNTAGVEFLEVIALKPDQADVQLFYTGDRKVVIESLKETGLKFTDRTQYLELYL